MKLLSLGLLVLAAVVAVRRRLWLEAMIVAATIAVLLVYRTDGAGEARYLIPLSPFFIGAIFAGFRLLPRPWAAPVVAALAAFAAVVGGIHYYAVVTPSTATFDAEVAARRGAYRWVKDARSPGLGSGGRERRPVIPLQRSPNCHGDPQLCAGSHLRRQGSAGLDEEQRTHPGRLPRP